MHRTAESFLRDHLGKTLGCLNIGMLLGFLVTLVLSASSLQEVLGHVRWSPLECRKCLALRPQELSFVCFIASWYNLAAQVEHKAKSAWDRVANACNGLPPWIARREICVLQRPVALRLHAGRIFHKKLVFFMTVLSTGKP